MGVTFSATTTSEFSLILDDVGGGISYIGEADPGTETSAALWRIKRLDESDSDNIIILWADGEATFDKIWDNRAGFSYS